MKICIVTIGQAPREDFEESINRFLRDIEVVQVGVLDEMNIEPSKPKTTDILVSKLKNGEEVKVDKEVIDNKIQDIIEEQNKNNIDLLLIACTGEFKKFKSTVPVIYPDKLIGDVLSNLLNHESDIGIIMPNKMQKNSINQKWRKYNFTTKNFYISPYQYFDEEIEHLAAAINKKKLKYVFCDCIGYNETFKKKLSNLTDSKIIISKDIVFSNLGIFK